MMSKKFICIIIALTMVISLLAACGTPTTNTTTSSAASSVAATVAPTQTPADVKTTIRIFTRMNKENGMGQAFYSIVDQFTKANPNITIQDESVVGTDDGPWQSKLKAAAATGDMYELVENYGGGLMKGYFQNGLFIDLQSELDKDPAWKDSFLPVLDTWQYSDLKGQFGLPNGYFGVGLYYNKDLFTKYNLQTPKTIEDFLAVSEVFKKNGIVPLAMSAKTNWRHAHLLDNLSLKTFGFAKTKALADRTANYTDADMVGVFSTIKDWQAKGIFGTNIMSFDYDAECTMFYTGKTAMHEDGSWFISSAIKGAPDLVKDQKIGFIPFPSYAAKPEFAGSMMGGADGGLSVANSKDEAKNAAAIKLLKFLTNIDNKKAAFENFPGAQLPPFKGIKADAAKVDYLTAEYMAVLGDAAKDMRTEINTYDSLPQIQDVTRNAIQGMLAGNTPEKATKAIQDEIDKSK